MPGNIALGDALFILFWVLFRGGSHNPISGSPRAVLPPAGGLGWHPPYVRTGQASTFFSEIDVGGPSAIRYPEYSHISACVVLRTFALFRSRIATEVPSRRVRHSTARSFCRQPQDRTFPRISRLANTSAVFPQSQLQRHTTLPLSIRFSAGDKTTSFPNRFPVKSDLLPIVSLHSPGHSAL